MWAARLCVHVAALWCATMPSMAMPRKNMFIRVDMSPDLPKRFKIMAAEAGLPYHKFLTFLLDKEESRRRRQAAQLKSPLHRPAPGEEVGFE